MISCGARSLCKETGSAGTIFLSWTLLQEAEKQKLENAESTPEPGDATAAEIKGTFLPF
jgi:hypothetical protein